MDPNPLISILLPVANGAEFLFESLSSVLYQTYPHWECLVILNGQGLEGPAEAVASAFTDSRIRILKCPTTVTNKAAALNAGVAEANPAANWIALLDVDDIWAPHKLAKQIPILSQNPQVVATHARYFGEFHGIPKLPTGWIDPHTLADVNPIINSSALLRKDVAHWDYHPQYPDSLEDYYMWMKLAADPRGGMYVIPEVLVNHRIHRESAFNSRGKRTGETPAYMQTHFRDLLHSRIPTIILTTVCNNPTYVRAQWAALCRFVPPPWRFVVFNDAKDWPDATNFGDNGLCAQITTTCKDLGIPCIPVPNQHHRHMQSASARHCDTLRHVMRFVQQQAPGRFWMLDSDMWPVAPYTVADLDARFRSPTLVRQVRQHAGCDVVYGWPNLWWLDTSRVDVRDLCWDLAPSCDTGGASAAWIARQPVAWLPPHLSSGAWGIAELPTGLPPVRRFLEADPRNTSGTFWAELYDGRLLHLRAGSNWNGEGPAVHQQVSDLVKVCFA